MVTYPPAPKFSAGDKRLLSLLSTLLLERLDAASSMSNLPGDNIALTDAEAEELALLLERLLDDPDFKKACVFIEELGDHKGRNLSFLREIYLSARRKLGRSRAVASIQWSDFLARLGLREPDAWYVRGKPMSLDYFRGMERKLFHAADLNPRVVSFVMKLIAQQDAQLEEIRAGRRSIIKGTIDKALRAPLLKLRAAGAKVAKRDISSKRVAATITIVSNLSVLYTTRDWSVTSVLSTLAGALIEATAEDK